MTTLRRDRDFFIQLTNLNFRGTHRLDTSSGTLVSDTRVTAPNFLTQGWAPIHPDTTNDIQGATDTGWAVYSMMDTLNDQCPDGTRKSIIVVTDGMNTCNHGAPFNPDPAVPVGCGRTYEIYQQAQDNLLSLIPELKASRIAVTSILGGDSVQPNIYNRERPEWDGTAEDRKFMDFREAVGRGYGGSNISSPDYWFTDFTGSEALFDGMYSETANPFREPNGVMMQLAAQTGGLFCTLSDIGADSDYDQYLPADTPQRLKNSVRTANDMETRSVNKISQAENTAGCMLDALTQNSFILAERD